MLAGTSTLSGKIPMPNLHDIIKNKKNNKKYIIIRVFEKREMCLVGPWTYALDEASIRMLASSIPIFDVIPFCEINTEYVTIFPEKEIT